MEEYDVLIIGAGAAGYSAAVYAARFNLKTIVIGKEKGGLLTLTHLVENWPGVVRASGLQIMEKLEEHVNDYKVPIVTATVEEIKNLKPGFEVVTDDKTYKAKDVLVGDRNAVIIAARSSAYGHLYETKVQCPNCQNTQKLTFDLSNPLIIDGDLEEFDVEETEVGSYVVTTPKSQIKVELRLLTGADESKIVKLMSKNTKQEVIVSTQMKLYINSVNGHNGAEFVNYFVNNVPAYEARWLRKCYEALAPNIKVSEEFECESCGFEQEMEVPFNTDFFWPDQ